MSIFETSETHEPTLDSSIQIGTSIEAMQPSRTMGNPVPPARWERLTLALILILAASIRLARLSLNGYGNSYYAAAVRSMLESWHNFFFVSFDPAGFISVDKPPVAFWLQTASAKLFGYHGWSLLLPQALAGVASVALVWYLVRRVFGGSAGLIAALVLTLTPISVAIDRNNSPDSILVLFLLLAAWALVRAVETGQLSKLVLSAVLVGIGFNVKMLQAFVVLPTFGLYYLLCAHEKWSERLLSLATATSVLILVCLSWALIVDAVPATRRPYVGSTQNNSELSLIMGYNGLGRLSGQEGAGMPGGFPGGPNGSNGGFPPFSGPPGSASLSFSDRNADGVGNLPSLPNLPNTMGNGATSLPGGPGGMMLGFGGTPGIWRLGNRAMAGQITWLFPLAIIGLLIAISRMRLRHLPLEPRYGALLLWSGWLFMYALVFSLARGIIHQYYLVMLAPALAALVGVGTVALWTEYRRGGWRSSLLFFAILFTAAWQTHILADYPDWKPILTKILWGGVLTAIVTLVTMRIVTIRSYTASIFPASAFGIGLATLMVCPSAWAFTPVLVKGNNVLPSADPGLLKGIYDGPPEMDGTADPKLIDFLQTHRHGERFLLMTGNTQPASPIIIKTGEAVLAAGGFMGADPALTTDQLAHMIATRQIRYVLIGSMGPGGNSVLSSWVQEHGKPVASALWRSKTRGFDRRLGSFDFPGWPLQNTDESLKPSLKRAVVVHTSSVGASPSDPGGMPLPPAADNGFPFLSGGSFAPGRSFPPGSGGMGGPGEMMQLYDCATSGL